MGRSTRVPPMERLRLENYFPLKWAEENLQICCGLGGIIPTIYYLKQ